MTEPDWSLATFDGVRRAQAARVSTLSSDERLAWLDDVLEFALASGVLEQVRQDRQRAIDRAWYGSA